MRVERDGRTIITYGRSVPFSVRTVDRVTDPTLRLVTLGPVVGGHRKWNITQWGREVLAAHDAKLRAETGAPDVSPDMVAVDVVLALADRYRTAAPADAGPIRAQLVALLVDDLTTLSRLRQVAILAADASPWDRTAGAGVWLDDMLTILNTEGTRQ
ncbi:hypothetical protein AB0B88_16385 [Micromonospora haikouensis]|uniref:hypothetical protein n=1 Tax=Actinomycetes TaxID=1760 RepID=UPI0034045513